MKAALGKKTSSQNFQKGQTRLHKRPQSVCVRTHYTQKRIRVVLLESLYSLPGATDKFYILETGMRVKTQARL